MKHHIVLGLFGLALSSLACTASAPSDVATSTANHLILNAACTSDADCPPTFECEAEVERGVSQSFCKSHQAKAAASRAACPPGEEAEVEHGTTLCKAHDDAGPPAPRVGDDDAGAPDDDAGAPDDRGRAPDDDAGAPDDRGRAPDDDAGAPDDKVPPAPGGVGAVCTTSADCATGLECEVELEHGVTISRCREHGRRGGM